nr:F-box/kelch-repeat protein At1g23390-like [Ziziphus jujuba var. spinosa]
MANLIQTTHPTKNSIFPLSHHSKTSESKLIMAEQQQQEETPIHGDVLEAVLSHVPLIDLLPAYYVSKSWKRAVSSSLLHVNTIKPWLIVHAQSTRSPYSITTHAYDPRSRVWIQIHRPSVVNSISALRSSHSTLLYMLSPSKFAFSFDPLHHTWHHADPPLVWRVDPIVAMVGHLIVVAGGACDYEDDPLAVEIYDLKSRAWERCDSMPSILKDSASSTWLSIAVDGYKMYVTEKCSGTTYAFNPSSKTWFGPFDLRPEPTGFCWAIGFAGGSMLVVGLLGNSEDVKSLKMWEVRGESLECKEIGEMPASLVEKLKSDSPYVSSIAMSTMGNFVYLHNQSDPREVIQCEIVDGMCRWGSVRNAVVNDTTRMQRMVLSCGDVGMKDLHTGMAMGLKTRNLEVIHSD